jgi:Fe-S cluster assembly ATP-binding protein
VRGLAIKDLHVKIGKTTVLKGVNLEVKPGEIHALMGPNGSGKSSLAYTIMGREGYEVIRGEIQLNGENITETPTHERALKGLFLTLQEPPELPGVRMSSFLIAIRNKREGRTDDLFKLHNPSFLGEIRRLVERVGLPVQVLQREVNRGFSGGEKKRSELLQALVFDPEIIILDEPDSGLDVDGVRLIASILKNLADNGKGILLITHYTRMFNFIRPDKVSILYNGKIIASGGVELAELVEKEGYKGLVQKLGIE